MHGRKGRGWRGKNNLGGGTWKEKGGGKRKKEEEEEKGEGG